MSKHTFNQQAAESQALRDPSVLDPLWVEIDKLREKNRRLRAAIKRGRKCQRYNILAFNIGDWNYTTESDGRFMQSGDVLEALRLRK